MDFIVAVLTLCIHWAFVVGSFRSPMGTASGANWRGISGHPMELRRQAETGFYVTDNDGGNLFLVPRSAGAALVILARGLKAPADLVVDSKRGWLVIPENAGNRLSVYRLRG